MEAPCCVFFKYNSWERSVCALGHGTSHSLAFWNLPGLCVGRGSHPHPSPDLWGPVPPALAGSNWLISPGSAHCHLCSFTDPVPALLHCILSLPGTHSQAQDWCFPRSSHFFLVKASETDIITIFVFWQEGTETWEGERCWRCPGREFPGSPVVRIRCFHCQRRRFNLWSGI